MSRLFVGFKGQYNASYILVSALSDKPHLLTNSFDGLKKDIAELPDADEVFLFGIDPKLKDAVRIEVSAENNGIRQYSALDLSMIKQRLTEAQISCAVVDRPTHYLCNAAYWHALEKYRGKAVFIHIPPKKYIDDLIEPLKRTLCS